MFGIGGPEVVVLLFIACLILPFVLNARLARSRGKNVALMLLLTVIFSWIVTLILAFMPIVEPTQEP